MMMMHIITHTHVLYLVSSSVRTRSPMNGLSVYVSLYSLSCSKDWKSELKRPPTDMRKKTEVRGLAGLLSLST